MQKTKKNEKESSLLAAKPSKTLRKEFESDGFDLQSHRSHYHDLQTKLEYHDLDVKEKVETLETLRDMLDASLSEIGKIRNNPESNISKREKSDQSFSAEVGEFISGLESALEKANIVLAEANLREDLFAEGLDISGLYQKIDDGAFDMSGVFHALDGALSKIENIRSDPTSAVSKRENSDPTYQKQLEMLVGRLKGKRENYQMSP